MPVSRVAQLWRERGDAFAGTELDPHAAQFVPGRAFTKDEVFGEIGGAADNPWPPAEFGAGTARRRTLIHVGCGGAVRDLSCDRCGADFLGARDIAQPGSEAGQPGPGSIPSSRDRGTVASGQKEGAGSGR